jgi:hypothetical protein
MINKYTANRFVVLTPFKEALTYNQRIYNGDGATDTFTSYALPNSRSRELDVADLKLDPTLLNAVDLVFEIWSPTMAAVSMPNPLKDDVIVDASGTSYTVIKVLGEFHQNVWTLYCRKED